MSSPARSSPPKTTPPSYCSALIARAMQTSPISSPTDVCVLRRARAWCDGDEVCEHALGLIALWGGDTSLIAGPTEPVFVAPI